MTTDGILISAIKKEFGDLAYNADGSLNRIYLANHVFHHPVKLEKLNRLVHPRVGVDYLKWVDANSKHAYVIKEAALLFESENHQQPDKIIVVSAPEPLRISRVLKRDAHRTAEQIKAIAEKQMPEDEKLKRADYVIVNDETQMVLPQVLKLHEAFAKLKAHS